MPRRLTTLDRHPAQSREPTAACRLRDLPCRVCGRPRERQTRTPVTDVSLHSGRPGWLWY